MNWIKANLLTALSGILVSLGLISLVLSLTGATFIPGDILLLGIVLGVLGFISLLFYLVPKMKYFGLDRTQTMGMLIALTFSGLFILSFKMLTVFDAIEEFSVDLRFRLSSGKLIIEEPVPGTKVTHLNPKAHPAIQIIGIDNQAVDAWQGFPFSWDRYATLLAAFKDQTYNSIMFDIFFLDPAKNNYGLLGLVEKLRLEAEDYINQGRGIQYSAAELRAKSAYFSEAIEKDGRVLVDYAFETAFVDSESLNAMLSEPDMKQRLDALNLYRIPNENIKENENLTADNEWVTYPSIPIAPIARTAKGLGGANVKYATGKTNYQMPMVFKWRSQLYPSISLLLATRYYSIDVTKDVEVNLGHYVKLKNIPEKTVSRGFGTQATMADIMMKPNKNREVVIPIDQEGMMNINFIGPAFSFPDVSIHEISSTYEEIPDAYGGENKDLFREKILLVAMYYATGVARDIHPSPFGNTAGIEHHANALNTILMQDFISYASDWVNFAIFVIIGALIGFIVPRYSIRLALGLISVIAVLFAVETFFLFNSLNYIHTFLTPYVQMVLTMISIVAYRALSEEQNVKYIRSTFSKFVSKDVVNELLANPESLKLGGEKKEITVFFSDIRGFTTMSEALSPEQLVQLLNEYLSRMTDIVLGYRGTVDKYMGDAIMAFWGAPVPTNEHAFLACLASVRQIEALKELQIHWKENGYPVIDIGIGLNTGYAVVGNMGSAHRMDYTVMGDTINLGSRLEGTNKIYATRIIISDNTYEKVKDRVVVRELDLIRVKGKHEPVTIYELIDIKNRAELDAYFTAT